MTHERIDSQEQVDPVASESVNWFTHLIFFWCLGGVSLIYGIRLYHDLPIHPSFIPLVGAAFSAILAFTLVVVFRIYAGPIDFEADKVKLKGATGPIVLWCMCFMTVSYGLYLLGIGDATKLSVNADYASCSTGEAVRGRCPSQQAVRSANPQSLPPAIPASSPKS